MNLVYLPESDLVVFGYDDPEFGGFLGNVGHWLSNAAKVCGREIGKAEKAVIKAEGKIAKEIGKIPGVGAPLKAIFDAGFHVLSAPMTMTVDAAVFGKRLDKVFLDHIKQDVTDFKAVGPYAQMILSCVPGIGQGISCAIGAGLALANGQPIDQVLLAGVSGVLPGGPLAKAALHMAVDGVRAVATHQKVDFEMLASAGAGALSDGLGLPPTARDALLAGVHTASNLIHGEKLDKALTEGVISALPVDEKVKSALTEVGSISLDLAHGKRVDKTLLAHVGAAVQFLPIDAKFRGQITVAVNAGKSLAEGHNATEVLTSTLQSSVADAMINIGGKSLPRAARDGINIGLALGAGVTNQLARGHQLTHVVPGKLTQSGIELAKTVPTIGHARKLAGAGVRGFDIASGLGASRAHLFDVNHVRNSLSGADRMGFDMALSVRIGVVAHPPAHGLSAAAQAGFAMTIGMQGHLAEDKVAMMKAIQTDASATVGAAHAVKAIAHARSEFFHRVMLALRIAA